MWADIFSLKHACCYLEDQVPREDKNTFGHERCSVCSIVSFCLLVGTLNSSPPGFSVRLAESAHHVHFCFPFVSWLSQKKNKGFSIFPFLSGFYHHTSMFSVHHSPQQQNCSVSFFNSPLTRTVERLMVLIVLLDSALRVCWALLEWVVFINHAILPVKT